MNKKLLVGLVAGAAALLFAVSAKADEGERLPEPPEPDDDEEEKKRVPPPTPPDDDEMDKTNYYAGDPPNISKDGAGYDTGMFESMSGVRQWFVNEGYAVEVFTEDLLINNIDVKQFQRDYNKVANNAGRLNTKYGMVIDFKGVVANRLGHLKVDGTVSTKWPPTGGKNTLNALSIANYLVNDWGEAWSGIVAKAKGA